VGGRARPFEVDIFLPPMLMNSYGTLSGGSRSKTSRAIASDRSRDPPAVERSLPHGSIVTPNSDHWAAHSRFQGSFAGRRTGDPAGRPQPVAHVTRSRRHSNETARRPSRSTIVVPTLPQFGQIDRTGATRPGAGRWRRAVDLADLRADRAPSGCTDPSPGRVDVAHPVVALGLDAEPANVSMKMPAKWRAYERGSRRPGPGRGQRPAHLALDGVGRQERLGVHRVEVVDAVEERGLEAARAQRAGDRVEDDRPAEAPTWTVPTASSSR
jgi:hypothetical protein